MRFTNTDVGQLIVDEFKVAGKETIIFFLTNEYVKSCIVGILAGIIICGIVGKVSYELYMLCGCSKREAKKNAKRNRNIVDMVMSIKDLNSKED